MSRLPTPGQDNGNWGEILNDFLDQSHNADGSLKESAIPKSTNVTTDGSSDSKVPSVKAVKTYTDSKVGEVNTQLADKANYRQQAGPVGALSTSVNMIAGYVDNAIASDLYSCVITGGGIPGRENVIGGNDANVGTDNPKGPAVAGTGANYSAIMGGYDNVANGLASIIAGMHCKVKQPATHGSIIGGSSHSIENGDYNTVIGGTGNIVSSSGDGNSILGGTSNTVSGSTHCGTVVGGTLNVASGANSTVLGGYGNFAEAAGSAVMGMDAKSHVSGAVTHAYGKIVNQGDAQESRIVLRNTTANATPTIIGINGTSSPQMPDDASWYFKYTIVARRQDVEGETKAWTYEGLAQNNTGSNAAAVGTPTKTVIGASANTDAWDVAVGFGANSIFFQGTGEAGKTIYWVAKLELVELIA